MFIQYNIALLNAGIAQLVEHNLAKVGVASSNLVSRSKLEKTLVPIPGFFHVWGMLLFRIRSMAEWQSGYAAVCKTVYLGSIPGSASIFFALHMGSGMCISY